MDTKNECCPKFEPKKWHNKSHTWKKKMFITDSLPTVFHIPFPPMIGKKLTRMCAAAQSSKAFKPKKDMLVLFHDPSAFRSELFVSVSKKVPGEKNVTISGTFFSKVFEGPYKAAPKWMKTMESYLNTQKKKVLDYYVHYAYCLGCAKKFGHNYAILFAQLK